MSARIFAVMNNTVAHNSENRGVKILNETVVP